MGKDKKGLKINKFKKPEQKLNNARVMLLGGYAILRDLEVVDKDKKVWKGKTLPPNNMVPPKGIPLSTDTEMNVTMFFSRDYQPDLNDIDKICPEITITNLEVLGIEFTMVPKHKLLFSYQPSSIIAIVSVPTRVPRQ